MLGQRREAVTGSTLILFVVVAGLSGVLILLAVALFCVACFACLRQEGCRRVAVGSIGDGETESVNPCMGNLNKLHVLFSTPRPTKSATVSTKNTSQTSKSFLDRLFFIF
jgi:hypothetical protein